MHENLVAGVDFSGASKAPNETWIACGRVSGTGLEIIDVRKVGSHALAAELSSLHCAVVGIDCPFSLPIDFLKFLAQRAIRKDFQSWQEVAEHIVFMPFEDFRQAAVDFGKEPKRVTDKLVAPAQSPLHKTNPSMLQMTYHGMRMLASLDPNRFQALPFHDRLKDGCSVIEVYPRGSLRFFQLPEVGYKAKNNREEQAAQEVRRKILYGLLELRERHGLTFKEFARLSVGKKLEHTLLSNDHALDACIAAHIAANFAHSPQLLSDPFETNDLNVLLEGWIYSYRSQ